MKGYFNILLCVMLLFGKANAQKVDFAVFSFDRPLQLYSCLESIEKYITGIGDVSIIYRSSNDRFSEAYLEVVNRFSNYNFYKQGTKPKKDFCELVKKSYYETPHDYIAFCVDDIIVTDYVDCDQCIKVLEESQANGLYLRLGENITKCYMHHDKDTPAPPFEDLHNGFSKFYFHKGIGDWNYPQTVDMTIYPKERLKYFFKRLRRCENPNRLEGIMAARGAMKPFGIRYQFSKIVNIPLNLVNENEKVNRAMHEYTVEDLLEFFEQGLKIDIDDLYQIRNVSPHIEYDIKLIKR